MADLFVQLPNASLKDTYNTLSTVVEITAMKT